MFSNLAVTSNSDRLEFGKFKDLNIYGTKNIDYILNEHKYPFGQQKLILLLQMTNY